jgi:hypothetical protein
MVLLPLNQEKDSVPHLQVRLLAEMIFPCFQA